MFREFTQYINEGGAFGHLSNVWDINHTFGDMILLINDILSGKLDYVEEKTDAVNLMISWRKDKGLMAARNKGNIKNRGENALDVNTLAAKFSGIPLSDAFREGMNDLSLAIKKLTDKQKERIFDDGRNWMSLEVIGLGAKNVIHYGTTELRLHGTIEHDENGIPVDGINKENARILDGMLRQVDAAKQKSFHIRKLNRVDLPILYNASELKTKYIGELKTLMKKHSLKSSDTIKDYAMVYWSSIIDKKGVSQELKTLLLDRWVNHNKSTNIRDIVNNNKSLEKWIKGIDKEQYNIFKRMIAPIENVFLNLGTEIIKNLSNIMAINPNDSIAKMSDELAASIKKISGSDNYKAKQKLKSELGRLKRAGNIILPSEGITFMWNGHFMKLTGTFAPLNQIIGLAKYL